jgi:predicted dehydrogenase
MKNPDQLIRVGGVGTGRIFQHAHIRVYPKFLGKARLVGFFDVNPQRANQACEKYAQMLSEWANDHPEWARAVDENLSEMRVYDTLDEMLEHVDLIDVATHAKGRMAAAIAALEKGVNVMVEKPMARTWTEGARAARVAAQHPEALFQLNDDNAFDVKYRMLHDLLEQGAIGKVQHVTLIRGSRLDHTSVLKSQASALDNGGGCLLDYGSHGLAGAWYALGSHLRPRKVESASIDVLFPHRVLEGMPHLMEVDDNARIKVLFEDPNSGSWITVYLEASWCGGHIGLEKVKSGGQQTGYIYLVGDEGVIHSNDGTTITIQRYDGGETVIPMREYPGESVSFDDQIGSFLEKIRKHEPSEIDVNFGADVIAICGTAYLSAIEKRAVTLDEFKDFSRKYIEKFGDNETADDAIILDLLKPYRKSK